MPRQRPGGFFKTQAFTRSFRALLDSLPSEADRQRTAAELDALIQFLTELRERLTAIPSRDDAIGAREALDRLDAWFTTVKESPIVAAAIGVKPTAARPKSVPLSSEDIERAKATLATLDPLPIDELRTTLNQMAPRELRSVASAIGIRTTQRVAHDAVAHQIATKITNTRGYKSLKEGVDEPPNE